MHFLGRWAGGPLLSLADEAAAYAASLAAEQEEREMARRQFVVRPDLDSLPQGELYPEGARDRVEMAYKQLDGALHILDLIDASDYPRNDLQLKSTKGMVASTLTHLFGDSLGAELPHIAKIYDITDVNPFGMVEFNRRGGKTFSCAQFAVAVLMNYHKYKINVYSTSQDVSCRVLDVVDVVFQQVLAVTGGWDNYVRRKMYISYKHPDGSMSTIYAKHANVSPLLIISIWRAAAVDVSAGR